ncbi:MAG: FAD:protein FMN transferase [Deltaproteobacteria bacterium]|nr:FAD:protein FMN transferase [Deltaproteobacteria bacterium]
MENLLHKKIYLKVFAVLAVLAVALFVFAARDEKPQVLVFTGTTMTTGYSVKIVKNSFNADDKSRYEKLIKKELRFVNYHMSPYKKGGDIYRINDAKAGIPVKVLPQVIEILKYSQKISEMTGGAFDITVGPLIKLWGFYDRKELKKEPDLKEIEAAKKQIGYSNIILNEKENTVVKKVEGLSINLSAIAKGRAVDMVFTALEKVGLKNIMVEVGGEVRACGQNQKGSFWKIGIENPVDTLERQIVRVVSLKNSAIATSGDYRSYYFINNKRYSHTIDPVTGRPIEHGLASVSVISDDCMTADALATALTVMGSEKGMEFGKKHGLKLFFVNRDKDDGYIYSETDSFKEYGIK